MWPRSCGARSVVGRDCFEKRLDEGDVLVRCPGRCIDQKVVEWRPENGVEELSDHGCFLGAAPDDSGGAGREEEGE